MIFIYPFMRARQLFFPEAQLTWCLFCEPEASSRCILQSFRLSALGNLEQKIFYISKECKHKLDIAVTCASIADHGTTVRDIPFALFGLTISRSLRILQ